MVLELTELLPSLTIDDDFTQVADLWKLLPEDEKKRTVKAIADSLGEVDKEIQKRQLCHFFRADVDYGSRIAKALNIEIDPSQIPVAGFHIRS